MTISSVSSFYSYNTNYNQTNLNSIRRPQNSNNAMKGSNLDSNGDDSWSLDELKSFESESATFNSEDVMSTYDTDGDGVINSSERETLASDNALNLEDIQSSMMSESQGKKMGIEGAGKGTPPPPSDEEETDEITDITDLLTDYEEDDSDIISESLDAIQETLSSSESAATLEKYDTNNDGEISEIERASMEADEALEESEDDQIINTAFLNSVIEAYQSLSQVDSVTSESLMESIAV